MPITVKTFSGAGEAASALAADRGARFLGGGTLVMRAINEGDVSITAVVRTTDRVLSEIRTSGSRMTIGSAVTMAEILATPDLAFLHPVARLVGGPAVRNMASVGGNLFAPPPYGDFTVALLALDTVVTLHGGFGGREVPLEEFLASRGRSSGIVVTSVAVTRPSSAAAFRFRKVARVKPKGISVLSIAAHLPLTRGQVTGARIAYGAMAPIPMRARAVERALEGRGLSESEIAAALAVAAEGTNPATDAIASTWYRREMIAVHLKRLLLDQPGAER